MLEKKEGTVSPKREWKEPEIKDFGKIEDVTQKNLGIYDGSGLQNTVHHPSL